MQAGIGYTDQIFAMMAALVNLSGAFFSRQGAAMSKLVLGLDLGPNSIGWALVNDDPNKPAESKLIDLGVRVFPEGVDNFDSRKETSRNESRRIARGMRRQIVRRARRRRNLRDALIESDLWPAGSAAQTELYKLDPYELRARALDEPLTLHELGRVLLHINQRRGFKSNKKEEAKAEAKAKRSKPEQTKKPKPDAEKKTEDILLEMAELDMAIQQSGARTLGEYLHRKAQLFHNPYDKKQNPAKYNERKAEVRKKHSNREDDDNVRGRHTLRKMLTEEFNAIWTKQSKYHDDVLTEELRYGQLGRQKDIQRPIPKWDKRRDGLSDLKTFGLFGMIFFHRTLKPMPKEIVGPCELERNERRCARADRRAQRYRLLQEINNFRYIDPDIKDECRFDDGQRAMLVEHLATREKVSFADIRKKLGFLESIEFKMERGKRSGLQGMVTDWLMAKAIGKQWHEQPEEIKDGVVDALIKNLDDDETHTRLVEEFGLSADKADAALGVDLPDGYLNLSLVAIRKLLPHMERGLVYEHRDPMQSARAAAGYDDPWSIRKRLFGKLPDPQRTNPADSPIADIPNPVVKRALVELRKVVNAILNEQRRLRIDPKWRPDAIHVEMGRDVKTRPKDKSTPAYWRYKEEEEKKAEREQQKTLAKAKLRESGIPFGAGGRNIDKYLLWDEQNRVCIYSGKCISIAKLFTDEIEFDHILPRSQSLDDTLMNMVVCFHSENRGPNGKGQRTPRGWLEHSDPAKYDAVCQRAKKLPYAKYKRFLRKEVKIEDFIDRQLNDDRYIAKATAEYLKCLFDIDENKRGAVLGLKGQLTSTLRRQWGLETILGELPDSPAWAEKDAGKLRPGQKNRADHRHHAIDAIVLAMTSRAQLQRLAAGFDVSEFVDKTTGALEYKNFYQGVRIDPPWESFRDEVVERIAQLDGKGLGVSHRVERKVRGALHDDQPFGSIYGPGDERTEGIWVKRKVLAELSAAEVLSIRDTSAKQGKRGIRQIVLNQLRDENIEVQTTQPKRGKPKTLFVDIRSGEEAPEKSVKEVLGRVVMPSSGVPVKKVRILVQNDTITEIRKKKATENRDETQVANVKPNATHHLCIFRWKEKGKTKCDAVFVTMLDAAECINRQKQELAYCLKEWKLAGLSRSNVRDRKRAAMREIAERHPIIQRDATKLDGEDRKRIPPDAQFVISLSSREMVLLEVDGRDRLYSYNTAASTTRQMTFYPHTAAKHDGKLYGKLTKYPNSLLELNPRKVTVDPLGRIRWAND